MKQRVPDQEVHQRGLEERLFKEDCQAHKSNWEDATDHSRWRKQRKDNQDRCESVNVSSGTGSPG